MHVQFIWLNTEHLHHFYGQIERIIEVCCQWYSFRASISADSAPTLDQFLFFSQHSGLYRINRYYWWFAWQRNVIQYVFCIHCRPPVMYLLSVPAGENIISFFPATACTWKTVTTFFGLPGSRMWFNMSFARISVQQFCTSCTLQRVKVLFHFSQVQPVPGRLKQYFLQPLHLHRSDISMEAT